MLRYTVILHCDILAPCVQAMYQPARALLSEAYQAVLAFDDAPLKGRVLYLLARLSYQEAQYGQAIILCLKAQVRCYTASVNYHH